MLSIQHSIKPFQINSKLWFWKLTVCEIVDKLFHTYGCATATEITMVDDAIRTPWDPNKSIEFFNQIEDSQVISFCTNLGNNLPCVIIYALNNITNTGVFWDEQKTSITNTTPIPWLDHILIILGNYLERTRSLLALLRKHNICQHCNKWLFCLYIQHTCCQPCSSTCTRQCCHKPTGKN